MTYAGRHHIIFKSQGGPDDDWNRMELNEQEHTNATEGGLHVLLGRLTARQWSIYYLNSLLGSGRYYPGWLRSHGELLVKQIAEWYANEMK